MWKLTFPELQLLGRNFFRILQKRENAEPDYPVNHDYKARWEKVFLSHFLTCYSLSPWRYHSPETVAQWWRRYIYIPPRLGNTNTSTDGLIPHTTCLVRSESNKGKWTVNCCLDTCLAQHCAPWSHRTCLWNDRRIRAPMTSFSLLSLVCLSFPNKASSLIHTKWNCEICTLPYYRWELRSGLPCQNDLLSCHESSL